MSDLVLIACCASCRDLLEAPLAAAGMRMVNRPPGESLLEGALDLHPDAVLYELRSDNPVDLAVLQLLRRTCPQLPLVLIVGDASINEQRLLRELRPIYYAVQPADPEEIVDALRSALHRNAKSGTHESRSS
jgi:DNA-binding NtrC family response regulator